MRAAIALIGMILAGCASPDPVVFEEVGGVITVEAEDYSRQTLDEIRRWYLISAESEAPDSLRDVDSAHVEGASGGAYLEALPDTRSNHDEELIVGVNFSNEPGRMAILHYDTWFNTPGRYYVWVRTHATGTEDNGIHVGIDGTWPEHGQRMQWTSPDAWTWDSKQRTEEVHTGVPMQVWIDIDEPGLHEIQFSMREDGFEFDKWMMTLSDAYESPEGVGPEPRIRGRQ